MGMRESEAWTVEKRFRVTEVFLAILWVCSVLHLNAAWIIDRERGAGGRGKGEAERLLRKALAWPTLIH